MKAVILAGGLGTRISEESSVRPKPMIEIGGMPILWHIMKIYSHHGINDFVVCLGYKGYVVKEFFSNYFLHSSDVTIDLQSNALEVHHRYAEPWKVTLVDTGINTMTGGRLKRVSKYLDDKTFCCTYGDGVADVDLKAVIAAHRASGKAGTMTIVQPPGRFGSVVLEDDTVRRFAEKPAGDGAWINAGFFVLEPAALDGIAGDNSIWEREPLEQLAARGDLNAYRHHGFWAAMDTLRDKTSLDEQWQRGRAPWKVWS